MPPHSQSSGDNTSPLASTAALPQIQVVPHWLPLANRLDLIHSAESKDARQSTQHNPADSTSGTPFGPLLPFQELPTYGFKRPSFAQRIEPGKIRFGVPPSAALKLEESLDRSRAALLIQEQLLRRFSEIMGTPPHIKFFKQNKQLLMEIGGWPTTFDSSTPLELNGEHLVFIGSAPAVEPNWITVMVVDVDETHIPILAGKLKSVLYPHQILDFWKTADEMTIPGNTHGDDIRLSNFTGNLFLLVELRSTSHMPWSTDRVTEVARTLPGYVKYGRINYRLVYQARLNHGRFNRATESRVLQGH